MAQTIELKVDGMTCQGCVRSVEKKLSGVARQWSIAALLSLYQLAMSQRATYSTHLANPSTSQHHHLILKSAGQSTAQHQHSTSLSQRPRCLKLELKLLTFSHHM